MSHIKTSLSQPSLATEPSMPQLLVTPKQAAQMLALSERTLWTLTKSGEITHVQRGRMVRYHVDDLNRWIECHKSGRTVNTTET